MDYSTDVLFCQILNFDDSYQGNKQGQSSRDMPTGCTHIQTSGEIESPIPHSRGPYLFFQLDCSFPLNIFARTCAEISDYL